jgi:hypothetical protein
LPLQKYIRLSRKSSIALTASKPRCNNTSSRFSSTSARQFIDARGNVFVTIPNPALGVYFASTARNLKALASSNFSAVLPEKIAPPGSRPYRRDGAKNRAIRRVCDSKNPVHRLLRGRVRQ